jgi:hypothetical protein
MDTRMSRAYSSCFVEKKPLLKNRKLGFSCPYKRLTCIRSTPSVLILRNKTLSESHSSVCLAYSVALGVVFLLYFAFMGEFWRYHLEVVELLRFRIVMRMMRKWNEMGMHLN